MNALEHGARLRYDLDLIAWWIGPGSRVLECVEQRVNVVQANLDAGLRMFADDMFDAVVLSQALQAMHEVESVRR